MGTRKYGTRDIRAGDRFGRWTVTSLRAYAYHRRGVVDLVCECGVVRSAARADQVLSGDSASCGCLRLERVRARATTHGESRHGQRTTEYNTWSGIIDRCENTKSPHYKNYGGRGIRVCARWRRSFEAFVADIGRKPTPTHTIERINNDRGYRPENCRWATRKEQSRNLRTNLRLTWRGQSRCLGEWQDITGIDRYTIRYRYMAGWPLDTVFQKRPKYRGVIR